MPPAQPLQTFNMKFTDTQSEPSNDAQPWLYQAYHNQGISQGKYIRLRQRYERANTLIKILRSRKEAA